MKSTVGEKVMIFSVLIGVIGILICIVILIASFVVINERLSYVAIGGAVSIAMWAILTYAYGRLVNDVNQLLVNNNEQLTALKKILDNLGGDAAGKVEQ